MAEEAGVHVGDGRGAEEGTVAWQRLYLDGLDGHAGL